MRLRVRLEGLLEALPAQDAFPQLRAGLEHRSGDALAVAVDLGQDLTAQNGRLVFGDVRGDVGSFEKTLHADRRRDFDEGVAGLLEHEREPPEPARFVLGAEQHVDQGGVRPPGPFAEEHDLRHDENRLRGGLLQADQELHRVDGALAEALPEMLFLDQREKTGLRLQQLVAEKAAVVRVGPPPVPQQAVGVRQQDPQHPGGRLPDEKPAAETDAGEPHAQAAVAVVGEEKREVALELRGVDDDGVGRQLAQGGGLGLFEPDPGIEEREGPRQDGAGIVRQHVAVVMMRAVEDPVDPAPGPAGQGLRGRSGIFHGCRLETSDSFMFRPGALSRPGSIRDHSGCEGSTFLQVAEQGRVCNLDGQSAGVPGRLIDDFFGSSR